MSDLDPSSSAVAPPALERLKRLGRRKPDRHGDGDVLLALLLPGLGMARRRPFAGPLLFGLGVVFPVVLGLLLIGRRAELVSMAVELDALRFLVAVAAVAVLARVVAVVEARCAHRGLLRHGLLTTSFAYLVLGALAAGVVFVALRFERFAEALDDVFLDSSTDGLYMAPSDRSAGEFLTVLLLGGDEGAGRWSLRTDTMILVMVHRDSGRAALVSVPRNLVNLQFPADSEMGRRFPQGFENLANAIFPYVSTRQDLAAAYTEGALPPGAVALTEGLGYSLGVSVDDFALVNMLGFAELIDAVGGVTIELDRQVALPPSPPGARPVPPSIGPGFVHLDGTMALAYARTRYADSDYQRMGRQRELLVALFTQVGVRRAFARLDEVSRALQGALRTSLTPSELSSLVDTLGDGAAITESIGLVPPLVKPGDPDYGALQLLMEGLREALRSGEPFPFRNP
jgi:LCP family protein required for cell wall assembly